jgi:probable HAF family extracellular repeat protein
MKRLKPLLANVAILWSSICSNAANATGPFFMGLGDLAGGGFSSFAYDVSADGSVVVGNGLSASRSEAFRWTHHDGMIGLGVLAGSATSTAYATSADGAVVVGGSSDRAFRWTETGGMAALPLNGYPYGGAASGVSAGGSEVVGVGVLFRGSTIPHPPRSRETDAVRWTAGANLDRLGDLPGGLRLGNATGVSADGSVIVGFGRSDSGGEAFRWTQANGMVGLGDLTGGAFSSWAEAVSVDGSVIVGYGSSASGAEAFRWTQTTGMVGLGTLPGHVYSRADDVSADGSVIVGWSHSATDIEAFLWDASHGMRSLRDVLVNYFGLGASLAGWKLEYARAISNDGRVVVGYGFNPNGDREAWIARLAPALPGDFDADGAVDAADLAQWRSDFGTTADSDADNDNDSDGADFLAWQRQFNASPPALNTADPIPEPAALLLALAALIMTPRRAAR